MVIKFCVKPIFKRFNMKIKNQINIMILLLFVLICIVVNNTLNIKVVTYAEFGWVVDYRYGFCKRGFLGSIYHLFLNLTGTSWNKELLDYHILVFQFVMVCVSIVLILCLFKKLLISYINKRFYVFCLFVFLISSFYIKNVFDLNYGLDILIFNVYLVILLLAMHKKWLVASGVAGIACLFHEQACVFWVPVVVTYFLFDPSKKTWSTYFVFLSPFIIGLVIHLAGFPTDKIPIFYDDFSINVKSERMDNMMKTFKDQYDILNYVSYRSIFFSKHFFEILFSFFILGTIAFVYLSFCLLDIWYKSRNFYVIKWFLSALSIFSPFFLFFVAIDFWRFVGFIVFNGFLQSVLFVILSERKLLNLPDDNQLLLCMTKKYVCVVGLLLSSFSCFSPSLKSFGTLFNVFSPKTSINMAGSSPFVFYPMVFDFDLFYEFISVVPLNVHYSLLKQNVNNVYCYSSGGRVNGDILAPGKFRMDIDAHFHEKDPDEFKYVKIYDQIYVIKRNEKNSFVFDVSRVQSKLYPSFQIIVEPSSYDWILSKVDVNAVE